MSQATGSPSPGGKEEQSDGSHRRSPAARRWWMASGATALSCALLTGVTLNTAQADDETPSSILQAGAEKGVSDGYPGVIGLIRNGDSTEYVHAGVGNISTKTDADPKAKFRIASNTKTFTATVLLQLEGEGKLSLDDSVAKWLPDAVNANGYDGSKITIRELLNHTSSLPDYAADAQLSGAYYNNTDPDKAWAPQQLVNIALRQHAPQSAPGEKFGYANTNYVLAGMVIKAVTGNEPGDEIQKRIIEPLNLNDTKFATDSSISGNYLHGYSYSFLFGMRDVTTSNVQIFSTAGAIVSTLDDMATFQRALMTGKLLAPEQLKELKTTVPESSDGSTDITAGLGIGRVELSCGKVAWGHTGAVLGYYSEWLISEDGKTEVIHANTEDHMQSGTRGQTDTHEAMEKAFCAA
ncbi:serine hydrolase domain-containing protein [Streptomyces malaysiensis subsp. malaysiensis]|uniref:Beta-lactamase family protein n=2 Tax=Streptomyces TaxID=1883 RepID=A0ABX6WA85_STRMQ|nr:MULTISPECIES: serine hydrolase domain-containing protein [Streptomyces]AQA13828.1 penicillin-binding protein [Streptomyces autolyticus]QPI58364.1 beta-lactamase family protein [Streptomyces solisilvae]UHH19956.1 beta-lactamase family protein [Streptomyces sp. HNM0561]WHX18835.1 serine hydrolase domain-containing protein [Streptomyces sp. NA07423]